MSDVACTQVMAYDTALVEPVKAPYNANPIHFVFAVKERATVLNQELSRESVGLLEEIRALGDNWDGYDAIAVSQSAADAAMSVLRTFASILPSPDISPNPHGTISLEWESERGLAHMEVGSATFSLFVRPTTAASIHREGSHRAIGRYMGSEIQSALFPAMVSQASMNARFDFGRFAPSAV